MSYSPAYPLSKPFGGKQGYTYNTVITILDYCTDELIAQIENRVPLHKSFTCIGYYTLQPLGIIISGVTSTKEQLNEALAHHLAYELSNAINRLSGKELVVRVYLEQIDVLPPKFEFEIGRSINADIT